MSNYFSVVMCVNRDDGYLTDAINSILGQDCDNFEFIVVANNCSDELWDNLLSLKCDRLIPYRTQIGQLTFNLNYAVNLSRGDYIVRMDADDVALPNRLSVLDDFINKNKDVDIVGTAAMFIDEYGRDLYRYCPPLKNIKKLLFFKNTFIHPTVAIKKETLIKQRGYSGGFQSEDYDFWLRALRNDNIIFRNIDVVTLKYRININQSRGSRLAYAESASYLLREFILSPSFLLFFAVLINTIKAFVRSNKNC
tara:strand:- start:12933 stop:13688 length:756 start_codon:yes stop_codon:yes gene_type:complete